VRLLQSALVLVIGKRGVLSGSVTQRRAAEIVGEGLLVAVPALICQLISICDRTLQQPWHFSIYMETTTRRAITCSREA